MHTPWQPRASPAPQIPVCRVPPLQIANIRQFFFPAKDMDKNCIEKAMMSEEFRVKSLEKSEERRVKSEDSTRSQIYIVHYTLSIIHCSLYIVK